jgi:hypothetical protein
MLRGTAQRPTAYHGYILLLLRRLVQPQLCRIHVHLHSEPCKCRDVCSPQCQPIRVLVFVCGGTEAISYHVRVDLIANTEDVICSVEYRMFTLASTAPVYARLR